MNHRGGTRAGPGPGARRRARAGAVGHEGGRAGGGRKGRALCGDDRANGVSVAALTPAGGHAPGTPGLRCHEAVAPDVVEVRALVAAVATGEGHALRLRGLSPVVATLARAAGALARGDRRRPPAARRRGGRHQTVARRDASVIAHLQGPSARVLRERLGLHPRGDEARRRGVLKPHGHEGAWRSHPAQPVADHRVDGAAPSDQAGRGGGCRGWSRPSPIPSSCNSPATSPRWAKTARPSGRGLGVSSRKAMRPTHQNDVPRRRGVRKVRCRCGAGRAEAPALSQTPAGRSLRVR